MQLRYVKTFRPPEHLVDWKFTLKVTHFAWSPNNMRLAIALADRYIYLYDENGLLQDKFSTKPADKNGARDYLIRGLCFSPESDKLAVAQSDNIVFIYSVGLQWGDKKVISNKFPSSQPVTAMIWPQGRPFELVFGSADGKVRKGMVKTNKPQGLYQGNSMVVSLAASPDGNSFVSGHLSGEIYRYSFATTSAEASQEFLIQTQFVPYSLAWGEHVFIAGNAPLVLFVDARSGSIVQQFEYYNTPKVKEFSCVAANPSGHTMVAGNFDKFFVYVFSMSSNKWVEASQVNVENLYTVSAVCWKPDGSRMVVGSLSSCCDFYDACLRKTTYLGKYEFTYTSMSSVLIKTLASGAKMSIKSRFGLEIRKINIYRDRYVVARTPETLLVADMTNEKCSEVQWNGSGAERFHFDYEAACMVFNSGELAVLEYGSNEVLGSLRTMQFNPHLISVRLNEGRNATEEKIKKIAYLLDSHTIRIIDLTNGQPAGTINHDAKIDWLELNPRATWLLFRDKRRALHLFDLATQTRSTLLNFCNYVQWVPDSDVVVAQSRTNLYVWYSILNPDQFTLSTIKGDVLEIERRDGKTEVVYDEGLGRPQTISLNEPLIAFGALIDGKNFERAVELLESMPNDQRSSADAMWMQLAQITMEQNKFSVAQRCFAAIGDVAKAQFIGQIADLAEGEENPQGNYQIQAKLAVFSRRFKQAEAQLLHQGNVEESVVMYKGLHKWQDALAVAESKSYAKLRGLRDEYFQYLVNSGQEEIAGNLKEKEGDYSRALQLYLKGGFPSRAADLVLKQGLTRDQKLIEAIATALDRSQAFEKCGDFLESLRIFNRALEEFRRGHAYNKAVELARREFPSQVKQLHEEWGDYLDSHKRYDDAANHYIQALAYLKAINAAIEAGQWTKAMQIVSSSALNSKEAQPLYLRIAAQMEKTKKYDDAEAYYIKAESAPKAVQMYMLASMWEKGHKLARTYMPEKDVTALYIDQAQAMEMQGKVKEAEKLYITVNEADLAITMHKKNRQYDDMIRLVKEYRKDHLVEAHTVLAHQFEKEGNLKLAEKHFIAAGEWKSALTMYKDANMWEDTLRVAQSQGGANAYKQVAYAFAKTVGGEAGIKLLATRGLAELAVDYALERGEFPEAFRIAQATCKAKLPEVHLQFAMALEDEGNFERAEEEFVKAKKPQEAIDMYVHQRKWDAAMRVAEGHDAAAILQVYERQAQSLQEQKSFQQAETLYISAKKPESAIKMYKDNGLWDDAVRVAKIHLPRMLPQIQQERQSGVTGTPAADSSEYFITQAKLLTQSKNFSAAIDAYLKVTKEHMPNYENLQKVWESAVTLAVENVPNRANEIASVVGKRLLEIERYEQAAEIFNSVDMFKEAIDASLQGRLWDKARSLVQESAPQLSDYVEKAHQKYALASEQLGALGNMSPDVALDTLFQRGDWEKVYELAQRQGTAVVQKYISLHAGGLVKDGKYKDALAVLVKRGAPIIPANFVLYQRVAAEVLSEGEDKSNQLRNPDSSVAQELREFLYILVRDIKTADPRGAQAAPFERLLVIAHLVTVKDAAYKLNLKQVAAKAATSLLRYTTDVPVDKTFYDAGMKCREVNMNNLAFVFLNRFVDLTDLIENPDSGDIDNSDFTATDIPSPFNVPMPSKPSYTEDQREEAREWVLDAGVKDAGQVLPVRMCDHCNKSTFAAGVTCHSCKDVKEPCIVTGWPVLRDSKVQCSSCQKPANRDDWNALISKTKVCPWCSTSQSAAGGVRR